MKTYTTFEIETEGLHQITWSGSVIFYAYKNGHLTDTFNDFHIGCLLDARERALTYFYEEGFIEDPYVYSFEGFKK